MNEIALSELFEKWHKTSRQFKKYNLRHTKTIGVDG